MPYYFIAQIKIDNTDEYQLYLDRASTVFNKYNGKYLAVDKDPKVIEGEFNYSRSVLIEFKSKHDFESWYNSEDYQDILKHRLKAAKCDSILIRGAD